MSSSFCEECLRILSLIYFNETGTLACVDESDMGKWPSKFSQPQE